MFSYLLDLHRHTHSMDGLEAAMAGMERGCATFEKAAASRCRAQGAANQMSRGQQRCAKTQPASRRRGEQAAPTLGRGGSRAGCPGCRCRRHRGYLRGRGPRRRRQAAGNAAGHGGARPRNDEEVRAEADTTKTLVAELLSAERLAGAKKVRNKSCVELIRLLDRVDLGGKCGANASFVFHNFSVVQLFRLGKVSCHG
jgi:hypothetical protein